MSTPSAVATMQGRELDAAVHQFVIGEESRLLESGEWVDQNRWSVPQYSKQFHFLEAMVEAVRAKGWNFIASDGGVRILNRSEAEEFDVDLYRPNPSSPDGEMCVEGRGPTLLTAFARAALLATLTPES